MPEAGPFAVDPARVAGLDGAIFSEFVGRLIAAEMARAAIARSALDLTYRVNAADGGVDALVRGATATEWIPAGDSVWQFKAGDLPPGQCEMELEGATEALDILRAGGKYRLVLGKSLTEPQIRARRQALERKALELGIAVDDGTFQVFNGDALARWAEEFPALAVSPLINGPGIIGMTFGKWSASNRHATAWVGSESRNRQISEIRNVIDDPGRTDLHIEGVSGLGKTRLVMEVFAEHPNSALVVYIPEADGFKTEYLEYLQAEGRTAIVVIDECDARDHERYAAALTVGSTVMLVTIGEPSSRVSEATLALRPLESEAMSDLLRRNEPQLWNEAIRVVVEVAAGNVRFALRTARTLLEQSAGSAGMLVNPGDLRQFIVNELPAGSLFLASCAIALFSRLGFDGDVADELSTVARQLELAETDLRAAAAELRQKGLLTMQGRYRSVAPHPVAIYLAGQGWEHFGTRISTSLMPTLSEDLMERLFRRASEIGDATSLTDAIEALLGRAGPFASLDTIARGGDARLLEHLAVLVPAQVSDHLSRLIAGASDEDLRTYTGIRRTIVWTLEKLAWHSSTFDGAAEMLLRLALVETETHANNSTGLWVGLFSCFLPSTAASPDTRIDYLRGKGGSEDPRVRGLVVRAAGNALDDQGIVMVSAELQGGSIVERRGQPATFGDAWQYMNAAIDILSDLAGDAVERISAAAVKELVDAIHGSLGREPVRQKLIEVFSRLRPDQLRSVRAKLLSLEALFERVGDERGRAEAVDELIAGLPSSSTEDDLWVITRVPAWDRQRGTIDEDLRAAVAGMPTADAVAALLGTLVESIPAAYEVGRVLASIGDDDAFIVEALTAQIDGPNPEALIGYLRTLTDSGHETAYDEFIDQLETSPGNKLLLTTRGPRTARASARAADLIPQVAVSEGARYLFAWIREDDDATVIEYLALWIPAVATQEDYNALVDLLALHLHGRPEPSPELDVVVQQVVELRRLFPRMGQQSWDWDQLASRLVAIEPRALVDLLTELVEADSITLYDETDEGGIFREALQAAGDDAWRQLMDRVLDGNTWRLSFAVRGWLAHVVDTDVATRWVGASLERARALASVASVGDDEMNGVARFLIQNFGPDERVSSYLYGEYMTGSWSGSEADRIAAQITQVEGWIRFPGQPSEVKAWARRILGHLRDRLREVEQREREDDR